MSELIEDNSTAMAQFFSRVAIFGERRLTM